MNREDGWWRAESVTGRVRYRVPPELTNTREMVLAHGSRRYRIILPRAADELIDEARFEVDEFLPYWADLWPSAKALARYLLDHPEESEGASIIELGAGVALPSLVLRSLGRNPLITDWAGEALAFAQSNMAINGLDAARTAILDWRHPPEHFGRFDLAIGADLVYEARNPALLAHLLPRMLAPNGRFLLADPGRKHFATFCRLLLDDGWTMTECATIDEPQDTVNGLKVSTIRIVAFSCGLEPD